MHGVLLRFLAPLASVWIYLLTYLLT